MNILLLTAHSIAEFDDLRMLHQLGHNVFSIGAYTNPAAPSDDKRPALPEVPYHADLAALVEGDQMAHKANLPDALLDWADTVIVHHFPEQWIAGNWDKYRAHGTRVIWRTCGQSNPALEQYMAAGRAEGLQIVRYSPRERNLPNYAGEDALIRFGKEPDEWSGWHGKDAVVGNVTQNMMQRGDACGYGFWQEATQGLPVRPAGPGSEAIGGMGSLGYETMRQYLRQIRVYLYTGTQPASYTLGLIEAMLTGVPVVSIGPAAFGSGWIGEVFEGQELTNALNEPLTNDPSRVRDALRTLLDNEQQARILSLAQQTQARVLFGMDKIKAEWAAFLG